MMKAKTLIIVFAILAISCATTKTFPVSDLAPAAEITVTQKTHNNDNNEITVEAEHLASPDRVRSGATAYVVWLYSEENGLKNIGAFYNENGEAPELETVTSFTGSEIFITVEQEANISEPQGPELTRVKL